MRGLSGAVQHGDDEVMVAVVIEDPAAFAMRILWSELVPLMPRFAVPRFVRVLDELPETASQRVRKHELRAEGVTADTSDREALGWCWRVIRHFHSARQLSVGCAGRPPLACRSA